MQSESSCEGEKLVVIWYNVSMSQSNGVESIKILYKFIIRGWNRLQSVFKSNQLLEAATSCDQKPCGVFWNVAWSRNNLFESPEIKFVSRNWKIRDIQWTWLICKSKFAHGRILRVSRKGNIKSEETTTTNTCTTYTNTHTHTHSFAHPRFVSWISMIGQCVSCYNN